jgi:hypothetical protein
MLDKLAVRIFGNVYNNLSDEKKSTILVVLAASLVISITAILILEKDFLEDIAFLILIGLAFLPRFREFWSDVFGKSKKNTEEKNWNTEDAWAETNVSTSLNSSENSEVTKIKVIDLNTVK